MLFEKINKNTYLSKNKQKKTIVIPVAQSGSILECVDYFLKKNIVNFILIGDINKIKNTANVMDIDLSEVKLINIPDDFEACQKAALLTHEGKAQIIMKGLSQTSVFVKSILNKKLSLFEKGSLLSMVSIFKLPGYHKELCLTDSGLNILPDLDQKIKIMENAVSVLKSFGIDSPKVACIAPVEKVNTKIKSTVDANIIKDRFNSEFIDGPLAFDVAVSKKAASIKGIKSNVAGDADILLFPELDTANAVYKSLTIFGGGVCASIVAGLKIPVVLTSRADTKNVKCNSIKLALNML